MRRAGEIVAAVLQELTALVKPGVTTAELDRYAEGRIRALGAVPSFKGYHGFPATLCTSINQEVVHGIPDPRRVLQDGDLLKIDAGASYQGFHADSCVAVAVGTPPPAVTTLIAKAQGALDAALLPVKAGNYLLDIASCVEDYAFSQGVSVVQEFTGHGIGRNLHEEPAVFNYRTISLPNVQLRAGMVLALEPIINAGDRRVRTLADQWTVVTTDGSLSAQFEHTVLVTATGGEVLTQRFS